MGTVCQKKGLVSQYLQSPRPLNLSQPPCDVFHRDIECLQSGDGDCSVFQLVLTEQGNYELMTACLTLYFEKLP